MSILKRPRSPFTRKPRLDWHSWLLQQRHRADTVGVIARRFPGMTSFQIYCATERHSALDRALTTATREFGLRFAELHAAEQIQATKAVTPTTKFPRLQTRDALAPSLWHVADLGGG
jgi:hypothetical protein